jgi:DNA-binding response OmpR family regulator
VSTTVLLVASNAGQERQVEAALQRAGYAMLPCETFSSGRRAFHEGHHALAIVDGVLPDGKGLDLLVAAMGTPILLLSDDLDVHARLSALRAGAVDCVGKPYDPLHLAARAVSALNVQKGLPPVSALGFSRRLLIVDDSVAYASALADELRKDGHDVALARAAHEALSFGAAQEVDFVVVDAFLPDMNGIELRSRLRGIPALRRTPVLVLTGREKSALRGLALDVEAGDLLVKSRDLESVRMHVRRMLSSDDRAAPSSRRGALPTAHRSVPPPASNRSVPPPASHRSVPPPPSRRDGPPSSRHGLPPSSYRSVPPPAPHRSVPPPPSRRDGPPSSRHGLPPSSSRSSSPGGEQESPLVEQLAAASGLSKLMARGAVERACWRVGVKPTRLTHQDLARVVPELEQALRVFLPPDVVALRMADMVRLARG